VDTHITVLKFGGTSIQDAPAFTRVAQIVKAKESSPLIVIVSAMSGVTDALIKSFRGCSNYGVDVAARTLEEHFVRHIDVGQSLSPVRFAQLQSLIEISRAEIIESLERVAASNGGVDMKLHDAIVSHGERLAANLLALVLEEHGMPAEYVDARRCVITDNEHGNAAPLLGELEQKTRAELLPLLDQKRIPVLGGFIGSTTDGVTTTLGRGSSDYSATLIGAAVHAREIEIWTDVDGIQTADPGLVKSTRTVPHVSYAEAAQLAKLGARVMHPKMIEPVIAQRIPLRILNSHAPHQPGTLISAEPHPNGTVKAIAHKIAGESAIVGCVGHGMNFKFRVEPAEVGAVVRRLHAAIFET
jgi:aspartate kinase